jgi:hypothetical protein
VKILEVAWHRQTGQDYVGAVTLSDGYVRLVGRDVSSRVEVALSIPVGEIEGVHVHGVKSGDGGDVVLELADSQSIWLRGIGDEPMLPRMLAQQIRSAVGVS